MSIEFRTAELNSLALLASLQNKRQQMIKKQAGTHIFKRCSPADLQSWSKPWAEDMELANQLSDNDSNNMYTATVSSDARLVKYGKSPHDDMIKHAKEQGADIAEFSTGELIILNHDVLADIKEIGSDSNSLDIGNVGAIDNYTGMAGQFFGGSIGAGAAGFVEVGAFQL